MGVVEMAAHGYAVTDEKFDRNMKTYGRSGDAREI